MSRISRREFLERGGRTALGLGLGAVVSGAVARPAAAARKSPGANDKIVIGAIGCGGMGMANLGNFMGQPDVAVAAVCDVDQNYFKDRLLQWEIHVGDPGLDGGGHHGAEFIGDNGILRIDRGGYYYTPKGDTQKEGPTKGEPVPTDHWRNFLDCVKTRELARSDIYTMAHSNALCHLANLAYLCGRSIRWDGEKQEVVGHKEAMQVQSYYREYRRPWVLPRHDLKA